MKLFTGKTDFGITEENNEILDLEHSSIICSRDVDLTQTDRLTDRQKEIRSI